MQSEPTEKALEGVIRYCRNIIQLKDRPSDEAIKTAECILRIIDKELNKK